MKRSKIDVHGLGDKVTDLIFNKKMPYRKICEKIEAEDGIEISPSSLTQYKKFIVDSVPSMVSKDKEYRNKLARMYLDTVENLSYLVQKIKEEIEKYPEAHEWKQRATFYGELIPVVKMLVKRAGEIKPSQFIKQENYQLNAIQINQVVQTQIVKLIDDGDIPLEMCSDKVKQFYTKLKGFNANS